MINTENDHLLSPQQTDNNKETEDNNNDNQANSSDSDPNPKRLKRSKKEKKEDEIIFGGRFECKKTLMLGSGTFGEIYLGIDNIQKDFVAVKLEKPTAKHPQLRNEKLILDIMADIEGFPRVFDYGGYLDSTYMAMELLGPSTGDLFEYCGFKFTMQTVLLLAIQMIERIQELHNKNYIHRDIKPENFTIGTGRKTNTIFLIDFGLCKKYKDNKTMEHIIYRENREITGTPRYASINNHLGIEQSRRDDLEGIAYVLIYFLKRRLPWQNVEGKTQKERYTKILEKKLSIPIEILCKDLPNEFAILLSYAKNLRYDERPDYNFLKGLFTDLLFDLYMEDFVYDWTVDKGPSNLKKKMDKKLQNSQIQLEEDKERFKENRREEGEKESARSNNSKSASLSKKSSLFEDVEKSDKTQKDNVLEGDMKVIKIPKINLGSSKIEEKKSQEEEEEDDYKQKSISKKSDEKDGDLIDKSSNSN